MYSNDNITAELLAYLTAGEMGEGDELDMIQCVDDINCHHDDDMYFIIGHRDNIIELFGCPSEEGLENLSIYFGTFMLTSPDTIFKGTIVNPKELPGDIDGNEECVLIIFADHKMSMFQDMDTAVKFIEESIAKYSASTIEDFAVIIGNELEFNVEDWNSAIADGEHKYA